MIPGWMSVAVALPLLCFVLIFSNLRGRNENDWRRSFLEAAVIWGILLTIATEALSFFGSLSLGSVVAFWLLVSLPAMAPFLSGKSKRNATWKIPEVSFISAVLLIGVILIALAVGTIALLAPPNNYDSMTYHMSRVVHWIQNRTVSFYPTHNIRQLFQSPWAEYAILHLQLLSFSDRFANLVQWFSMLGSIIGATLIAKQQLGANQTGQVIAAVFVATIPMGILQASSTQNDYVLSFWLICFVYFIQQFRNEPSWGNAISAAGSLGLAVLTKPGAYIYAFPFLLISVLAALAVHRAKLWPKLAVATAIVAAINFGHTFRNVDLFGSPLGPGLNYGYGNQTFALPSIASNVMKNVSLHLATPSDRLNHLGESAIRFLHARLGVDIDDRRTTYTSKFYIPNFRIHEDTAGNPLHLLLIGFSLFLLLTNRRQLHWLLFGAGIAAGFLLFSIVLKWQPWHSRLQLPLFVLSAPLVGAVVSVTSRWVISAAMGFLLLLSAVPWVCSNSTRPLIGTESILKKDRIDQYFVNWSDLKEVYVGATRFLRSRNCHNIGLVIGADHWEYPFWILLGTGRQQIRLEHVRVKDLSSRKSYPRGVFEPCAILSNEIVATAVPGRPNQWKYQIKVKVLLQGEGGMIGEKDGDRTLTFATSR